MSKILGVEMSDPRPWYKQVVGGLIKALWVILFVPLGLGFVIIAVTLIAMILYNFREVGAYLWGNIIPIASVIGAALVIFIALIAEDWALTHDEDDCEDDEWEYR